MRMAMSGLHSQARSSCCWILRLLCFSVLLNALGCQFAPIKSTSDWPWKKVKTRTIPDRILPVWTDSVLHQPGQTLGYKITLLFFWLQTIELAKERVRSRVLEGGHNIPVDVIERRYKRGIENLFKIYLDIVDVALIYDNSFGEHQLIAQTNNINCFEIIDEKKFNQLKKILWQLKINKR